jgi:hypothetical protein
LSINSFPISIKYLDFIAEWCEVVPLPTGILASRLPATSLRRPHGGILALLLQVLRNCRKGFTVFEDRRSFLTDYLILCLFNDTVSTADII